MKASSISKLIVTLFPLIALFSCEKEAEPIRTFLISKGDHYASPRMVESLQTQTLVFEAKFNETAMYDLGDLATQSNKNKLFGFADCNSAHHENSARFGWMWYDNKLQIYAYCYVNSQRVEQYVGTVNLNEFNRYEIQLHKDQYVFKLNNEAAVSIKRANVCDMGLYYLLYPYFGGDVPAPHDVVIQIKTVSI